MKTIRLFSSLFVTAVLAATLPPTAHAAGVETSTIKFSNPAQPGTVKLNVSHGDIRIQGSDSPEVTVRTSLKQEQERRKNGMRVLSASSTYSVSEKDNVITLSYGSGGWHGASGDFAIEVPRNTNVIVANGMGGDVEIQEVTGDIEVKSLNGEVKLVGLAGGALVETMNGEIQVDVHALAPNKPLSFTSMNGEVRVRLPADAKANVRLRSQNGAILTDFEENQLVTTTAALKQGESRQLSPRRDDVSGMNEEIGEAVREAVRAGVEAAREATRAARDAMREARHAGTHGDGDIIIPMPPVPPLPPMTGGKVVTGTLNGGGPEILISTMNGDVTLQKVK